MSNVAKLATVDGVNLNAMVPLPMGGVQMVTHSDYDLCEGVAVRAALSVLLSSRVKQERFSVVTHRLPVETENPTDMSYIHVNPQRYANLLVMFEAGRLRAAVANALRLRKAAYGDYHLRTKGVAYDSSRPTVRHAVGATLEGTIYVPGGHYVYRLEARDVNGFDAPVTKHLAWHSDERIQLKGQDVPGGQIPVTWEMNYGHGFV